MHGMGTADVLGRNIRTLRTQRGWTQADLAIKLGVVRATVASWETGRRIPEPDMLARIGQLFGVSVDALLGVAIGGNDAAKVEMGKDHPAQDLIYFLRGRELTRDDVEAVKDLLEARRIRRQRESQTPEDGDKGQS